MAEQDGAHPDLGGYVLGTLEPEEAVAFEDHLAGCDHCRAEVDELSGLGDLLALAAPPVDVPADLEARTFAAIEADSAVTSTPHRSRGSRRRPPAFTRRALAVAAAVVVLGAGAAVVRDATKTEPAAAEVITLEATPGHTGMAVAHVRATAAGGVIEMEVEGLAPPPPGSFFECWLVSPQGDTVERPNRISVGTFTVDDQGRATVRWDFKAPTDRFSRMGVTLEPDDGNPAQTTDKVLAATRLL